MIYVDDMKAPYGRMLLSHMMADTQAELFSAADALGIDRRHIQKRGTEYEHFDVSQSKRKIAVEQLGAKEVTGKWMIKNLVWPRRASRLGETTPIGVQIYGTQVRPRDIQARR